MVIISHRNIYVHSFIFNDIDSLYPVPQGIYGGGGERVGRVGGWEEMIKQRGNHVM